MAAYLRKLLAFVLFTVPVYIVLVIIWGEVGTDGMRKNLRYAKGGYGHLHSRLADMNERDGVQVLALGSSHAYRDLDPRVFAEEGIDLFVLGGSGMTPLQLEVLLLRHLDDLRPELVIVEVFPGTFINEGVGSSLDLIATSGVDLPILRMAMRIGHMNTWHALIYGTYSHGLGRNADFHEPVRVGLDTYVRGGYVQRDVTEYEIRRRIHPVKRPPLRSQVAGFERLMVMLEERGVPTVLVEAPVTQELYDGFPGRRVYDELFRRHGPYLNMQGRVVLDEEVDFYDYGHMNQSGVGRFNRVLIGELREAGLL